MTKPQEGDLVRIVTEGVVAYTHPEGGVILENHYEYFPNDEGVISIEVITPPFVLPTKRWAQVVDDLGILWTRKSLDGFGPYEWYNLAGVGNISRDLLARKGLRVISEGVSE
jgi:hypothetical protein